MADKHFKKHQTLTPFLDNLRALPFVDDVALDCYETAQGEGARIDGLLCISGHPHGRIGSSSS